MEKAINSNGKIIYAEKVPKVTEEKFICPCCKSEVLLKQGDVNVWHFAHKDLSICDKRYHENKGEWHRKMQSQYPEEYREVVIGNRIADVYLPLTNVIIEYQHSPITSKEIRVRTNDYLTSFDRIKMPKIIWVFDETKNDNIEITFYDIKKQFVKLKWKFAKKYLIDIDLDSPYWLMIMQLPDENYVFVNKYKYQNCKYLGGILVADLPYLDYELERKEERE